jgi:hypothetical protein
MAVQETLIKLAVSVSFTGSLETNGADGASLVVRLTVAGVDPSPTTFIGVTLT